MKHVILRWSAVAALSLSLAAFGCAKAEQEDGAAQETTSAPSQANEKPADDTATGAQPKGGEGTDGKGAPGAPDDATRHDKMVENAKKAIPAAATDDQTNAAIIGNPAKDIKKDVEAGKKELAATAKAVPAAKSTVASTDTYLVIVDAPSGKAGKDGKLKVIVKPKPGWKLNLDVPTKLKVEPPAGVTVAKSTLKKGDAAVFSEKKGATWHVGYKSASAGKKNFSGKLKFAVCTDATCDPKTATLAFAVDVK